MYFEVGPLLSTSLSTLIRLLGRNHLRGHQYNHFVVHTKSLPMVLTRLQLMDIRPFHVRFRALLELCQA